MLYMDASLNGVSLWLGKPCLNGVGLNLYRYVGFPGQLIFLDTQGSTDPVWTGLADRYQLVWYVTGPDAVIIPLSATPSQQLDVTLGQQTYTLTIYESSPS
jgi:hypothetical protein